MIKKIFVFTTFFIPLVFSQSETPKEKWKPFHFLIGKWEGTGTGRFGDSEVKREYEYFMGGTFILMKNQSLYEKQEKNPEGELHDDWEIISYDKQRKKYVIRQFHAEDITNTFTLDSLQAAQGNYEFQTEAIENFMEGWKAKEVYEIINEDSFVEIFYLAAPGKEYNEYIRNTFHRIK